MIEYVNPERVITQTEIPNKNSKMRKFAFRESCHERLLLSSLNRITPVAINPKKQRISMGMNCVAIAHGVGGVKQIGKIGAMPHFFAATVAMTKGIGKKNAII